VGIAMGAAGTDTALETADVALMTDRLDRVPEAVALGRRTLRIIKQNVTLAIGMKAVFFGLALADMATLWMAVMADLGTSLIVIANGLRLLRPTEEACEICPSCGPCEIKRPAAAITPETVPVSSEK
jgi:Zn2+/Cd2+-exporting ATPase